MESSEMPPPTGPGNSQPFDRRTAVRVFSVPDGDGLGVFDYQRTSRWLVYMWPLGRGQWWVQRYSYWGRA